jgi:hypothetical protein
MPNMGMNIIKSEEPLFTKFSKSYISLNSRIIIIRDIEPRNALTEEKHHYSASPFFFQHFYVFFL